MKTKFTLARTHYHHTLYDLAIFQEAEVLKVLTDYEISQHELHCLGTDVGQRLAPLGTTLHQLKQELIANQVEIDIQKDSLEQHRRWWETKLGILSQQLSLSDTTSHSSSNLFNIMDSARVSVDQMVSPAHHQRHSTQPSTSKPLPIRLAPHLPSSTSTSSPGPALQSSPPMSPQTRSHELTERLKGFALSLTGFTFQRDASGSSTVASDSRGAISDEGPIDSRSARRTRRTKNSLPEAPWPSVDKPQPTSTRSTSMEVQPTTEPKVKPIPVSHHSHPSPSSSQLPVSATELASSHESRGRSSLGITDTSCSPEEAQEDLRTPSEARKKEGFLFSSAKSPSHHNSHYYSTHSSSVNLADTSSSKSWKKFWCVVAGGQLSEYANWREGQLEHNRAPINLRFATVREARNPERRFCFEVITPQTKRTYQATMDSEMREWIRAITASIESLLNG